MVWLKTRWSIILPKPLPLQQRYRHNVHMHVHVHVHVRNRLCTMRHLYGYTYAYFLLFEHCKSRELNCLCTNFHCGPKLTRGKNIILLLYRHNDCNIHVLHHCIYLFNMKLVLAPVLQAYYNKCRFLRDLGVPIHWLQRAYPSFIYPFTISNFQSRPTFRL